MKTPRHTLKAAIAFACLALSAAISWAAPIDLLKPAERSMVLKYYEAQFGAERRDEMLAAASGGRFMGEYVNRMSTYTDDKLLESKESQEDWERLDDPNWSSARTREMRYQRSQRWRQFPKEQEEELPRLVSREREVFEAGYSGRLRDILLAYAGDDYHSAKVAAALLGDYLEIMPTFRLGPSYARYELGCRNDDIIRSDRGVALRLLEQAVARGGRQCAALLAALKAEGKHVVKDEAGAMALLAQAKLGGASAAYAYGKALAADPSERRPALEVFAALAGDATSPYREGASYHALVLSKDFDHAEHLTWLYVVKALNQLRLRTSPDWKSGSEKNLLTGEREKIKERHAYHYWDASAEAALSAYESKHGDGTGFMPWRKTYRLVAQERAAKIVADMGKGVRWGESSGQEANNLLELAHEGAASAQYDIGINALRGSKVFPRDEVTARKWFQSAAAQGFVPGAYNFAICLTEGTGGTADAKEAARLFRVGAMRADPLSQHNLGAAYGMGRGVARDYVEAGAWWLLCEAKVPQAKANLAKLAASADRGLMEKAKARSEILRGEIGVQLDALKKELTW